MKLVSFEAREKYLLVTGHGKRDNLATMTQASTEIYAKVQETKLNYVLVDYRKLEINVSLNDAFNIVKRYEVALPGLKTLTIAAVFEGPGLEFGRYWKDISTQRGFFIEIFEEVEAAEAWLLQQMTT